MKLIAIAFDDVHRAEEALLKLRKLEKSYLVDLDDAVTVIRRDDGKLKVRQTHDLVTTGALGGGAWGGLWGALIGLLFFNPLLGWAAGTAFGAAGGALGGKLTDIGVDDGFVREVGQSLQPGSSALFVLVRRATEDKLLDELRGLGGRLITTSLSYEEEAQLQAALEGREVPRPTETTSARSAI